MIFNYRSTINSVANLDIKKCQEPVVKGRFKKTVIKLGNPNDKTPRSSKKK